jgi:HEPN domain-containing protein
MFDVEKNINYWRNGAVEDYDAALLIAEKTRHYMHALFFCHLAVEKMLKAHVARVEEAQPPKIHNLITLAQRTRLPISEEMTTFLRRLNAYQMLGRYPDYGGEASLSQPHAQEILNEAGEVLTWLKKQF